MFLLAPHFVGPRPVFPGPIVMPPEGADAAQATLPTRVFMQGNDIQSMTPTQRHLIYSVRAIELDLASSPDTSPEQIRALIADDISPGLLFDVDVSHLGPIYRHLRDWLRGLGIPMEGQASRRIPYQLADTLYRDTADAEAARELSRAIVTGRRGGGAGHVGGTSGRNDPAAAAATAATISQAAQGDRAAHHMGMRFRGDAAKFLGTPDEALHEYVAEYQQVAHDYKLSAEQQLLYLHNLFGGKAKRFYDAHVYENVHSLQEAVAKMNEQYNTPIQQNEVKNQLAALRVSTFVAAGMTEKAALRAVYDTLSRLSPQLAPIHRAEVHLVSFLRGAVVGESWAEGPLERMATDEPNVQQLFLQLDAALGLKEEGRVAAAKDVTVQESTLSQPGTAAVMHTGQGMYAYPKRAIGATSVRPRTAVGPAVETPRAGASSAVGGTRPRFDPLSVAGCFNCDHPGHTVRQCPLPVDLAKAAQRKLAYYEKKNAGGRGGAATVLFLMCHQMQLTLPGDDGKEPADSAVHVVSRANEVVDTQLFETLLITDGRAVGGFTATNDGTDAEFGTAGTNEQASRAAGFGQGE